MTTPLTIFADAERLAIDHLTDVFVGRTEEYVPDTISPEFPPASSGFHVQIEQEAGDFSVRERCQVRVVCWGPAAKRTDVKALASLTQGLLNTHRRIKPNGGRSDVSADQDTKRLMCWFLVQINPAGSHPDA